MRRILSFDVIAATGVFNVIGYLAAGLLAAVVLAASAQAGLFNPKTFKLENGLEVVVIEDHRAPVVTHMVWFRAGAGDEPPGKSGIAHFLEHLMFKGTDKRKPGEFSAIVARNGGQDNAFTSQDYTGYFQNVARDKLDLVMGLFSNQMQNLKLTEKDIVTERKVILEERNARTDNNPGAKFAEELRAAFFRASPYGIPIIGWRHEIEKLGLADARAWLKKHYVPNNAILIIAGDVTVAEVKRLAEKHYGGLKRAPVAVRSWPTEPPHRADITIRYRDAQVKQPSVQFSYLAPSARAGETKHALGLSVLESILSGERDSRINKKLVIEMKLASSAGAFYSAVRFGQGRFGFYGSPLAGKKLADVEQALQAILTDVMQNGVSEAEVKRAIRRMTTGLIYARDNVFTGARVLGRVMTAGLQIKDIETWSDRVAKVTAADVNAAAAYVFKDRHRITGYLLPLKKAAAKKEVAK